MNRPYMRLSHSLVIAILLLLASSSGVFAQVNYTLTGTLNLTSGTDPLGLSGHQVVATTSISQSATPVSSSTTATSSTNTYSGMTIGIAVDGLNLTCKATSTPAVTVSLTDNVGAGDTLNINNCDLAGLATLSASAELPNGYMVTAVPASVPSVGLFSGTVNFVLSSNNSSGSFSLSNATLVATGTAPPSVTPSLTTWTPATVASGSTASLSTQVTFTTSPSAAVSFTTSSSASWLTVSPLAANTSSSITITANPAAPGLVPGPNSGTVTLTYGPGDPTPLTIPVTVTLAAAVQSTLSATPASLSFTYAAGGAAPASQSVNITATSPITIATSVTSGSSWLSATSSSTTTPATLTVTVNPGSLTAGNYSGTISITSSSATNSPLVLNVSLVVSSKPTLSASPTSLTFSGQSGGSNPASQSVSLTGSAALPFTIATSPSWLGVSSAASTTPATLVVTANIAGMAQGAYQGTITITSTGAGNSPLVIPVTLNVSAAAVTGPTITAVVSGASYATSGFSPGTIATIFGTLLGPTTGVAFSVNSQGTLDAALAGTTVTVQGIPAIPLFVQAGQVNIILPFTLGTSGQAAVVVSYNNLTTTQFNIPLTTADVQIFTANASGSGPGSILNQDYSVNTASNPAAPGSAIQIYGTGGGALTPVVTAGGVAGDTLANTATCTATVNGEATTVYYSGSAPGLVYGVDQFNIQVPADAPAGAQKVVLTIGGTTSQSDVTVFVK
jgi:uncharacterized protein (TIGR03437 family)